MGEVFDAILDVTLVYADGPPKFWDMVCGDRVDVILDVRVLPVDPALVSGDYQNDYVSNLRASRSHSGKGFVSRCI